MTHICELFSILSTISSQTSYSIQRRYTGHISTKRCCTTHIHIELPEMKTQFHYNGFVYWAIFVYFSPKYCLKHRSSRFNTILKADVYQIIQSNWFCVHIIVQGVRGCVKTRAPRGTDRSPENNKHFCLKLDFFANQKAWLPYRRLPSSEHLPSSE